MSSTVRKTTRQVRIADVRVGGGAPIVVQSMTNTDTADASATADQVCDLARAGSELVRITVNTAEAAAQVARIREELARRDCAVPLVGDFHFNGHRLLSQYPECAEALAKYRINPGNVGKGSKRDEQFATMIETACKYGKPVRIGVNWGSLDQELLARLMDENGARARPQAERTLRTFPAMSPTVALTCARARRNGMLILPFSSKAAAGGSPSPRFSPGFVARWGRWAWIQGARPRAPEA